jgi:hypothetical protein
MAVFRIPIIWLNGNDLAARKKMNYLARFLKKFMSFIGRRMDEKYRIGH